MTKGAYRRGVIPLETWVKFCIARRENGGNVMDAARQVGISVNSAYSALRQQESHPVFRKALATMRELYPQQAMADDELSKEAARALNDFAYFRRRYFGRVSTPWAAHTANLVAELMESPHKDFVVVNQPPAVGKTALWTLDLPAWLICRNRGIRIMIGSAAQSTAALNSQQLRRELERANPMEAEDDKLQKGLAFSAEATLVDDYGNFKPARGEPWTAERFVVAQAKDAAKSNREPTVSAFGMDSRFLGNRCDFIIWDDLVDSKTYNTAEKREQVERWWQQYAETRLEPGGLLVLQGQRLHAEDLYNHVININVSDYGDDEDVWAEPQGTRPKYRHVKYQAHYEANCEGDHHPARAIPYDPAHPDTSGCLLDPRRLMFRNLMEIKDQDERLYQVSYQQEDIDPGSVLINPAWVKGGTDPDTGEEYPGCWDPDRIMGVVDPKLTRPLISYVTADPSPTKYWSIQWWVYHVGTEQRILIDHARMAMGANDFLDYIVATSTYDGLLDAWWQTSKAQGAPITHVIVEQNAAQRFLLQYDNVKRWSGLRKVTIIPHNTYTNKADDKLGVGALLPQIYKFGLVRLPSGDSVSRGRSMALVNEVTRWPESSTDDCVMAQWFGENKLKALRSAVAAQTQAPRFARPGWLQKTPA